MFEFLDFDYISDGEIDLIIEEKAEAYEPKGYLPSYKYEIRLHNGKYRIGSNKAVFLDLQGTLGGDGVGDIMDFKFFQFSIEAIRLLNECGILAIVVTNQSHIAKGILTMSDFNNRVEALKEELSKANAHLDAVYCCPHGRNDNCQCKKPLPGLLLQAQNKFNINFKESYVVGDMGMSDMIMARAVGAKAILVRTGVGEGSLTDFRHTWIDVEPDYVAENVLEAVKWITCNR